LSNKDAGKPKLWHAVKTPSRAAFLNGGLPGAPRTHPLVQIRFIALLKPPFKSSEDDPHIGWGKKPMNTRVSLGLEV
jgi:hypothetical protein